VCVTVCHATLINQPVLLSMWQRALQTGLAIRLFRDELFAVHQQVQMLFDTVKGYHKKAVEVKDHYTVALQTRWALNRIH